MREFLVFNPKRKEELRVQCDSMDTAVTVAVFRNHWRVDDCIATEIDEYTENDDFCLSSLNFTCNNISGKYSFNIMLDKSL